MIKVENKYEVGQMVYRIDKDDKCVSFEIDAIWVHVNKNGISVSYFERKTSCYRTEEELFASPEELRKHVFEDLIDFT